ncbi:MAG: hypothetical protein HRT88_16840, partial [Lentisphaeraceae bacterium]|nr:hypothetical protein [Lentisphaeraceae bacterium]
MSKKKSFFESAEWQAFIRPFKQFLAFFDKENTQEEEPDKTPLKNSILNTEYKSARKITSPTLPANKTPAKEPQSPQLSPKEIELQENQRQEFLLDKFAARKAERAKRQNQLEGLEETVLEENRPTLAEKQDFPQYSLEDFMLDEEEDVKKEVELRKFLLPEGGLQL